MKLFFKFFWMGISKLLYVILNIIGFLIPIAVGIISGVFLFKIISLFWTILFGIIITVIAYCMYYIIFHSIAAVKYCKANNTDSLKRAWENTAIDWDSFW